MTDRSPTVDATVTCPRCGAQHPGTLAVCAACGASLLAAGSPDEERGDLELDEEWRAAGAAGYDTDVVVEAADHAICPVCGSVITLGSTTLDAVREVRDTPTGRRGLQVVLVRCPSCSTRERTVVEAGVLPDGATRPAPAPAAPARPADDAPGRWDDAPGR